MAELSLGLDPTQQRFSTNFLDELDVSKEKDSPSVVPQPEAESNVTVPTNPFRSESPTPSDPGLELDHTEPGFDFAAHLETRDSMSSLDQVGLSSPETDSPSDQAHVNGVSADQGETADTTEPAKPPPTLVARNSEHWETFDENGKKVTEPHPPTANGGHSASGGQSQEEKTSKKGQSFYLRNKRIFVFPPPSSQMHMHTCILTYSMCMVVTFLL